MKLSELSEIYSIVERRCRSRAGWLLTVPPAISNARATRHSRSIMAGFRMPDCYPWATTTRPFTSTSLFRAHISLTWAVSHMAPMAHLLPSQSLDSVRIPPSLAFASANKSTDMLFNGEGEAFNVGSAIPQYQDSSLTPA